MKNGSKMEQNNKEKKVKKSKGGFKKFLKISGFTLLGIVGIIGVSMLIALISGAYSKEKINILSLSTSTENLLATNSPTVYIGDGSAEVVVMAGETLSVTLSYTPDNANQKTLSVKYVNGKNLLASTLDSVVAGEKFSLTFKENVGGEVEVKFVDSTTLVNFTLKVLVDNVVRDDDIAFSVDTSSGIEEVENSKPNQSIQTLASTNTGKRFLTQRNDKTKYITLQGKTANTVAPKFGAVVFKDSVINSFEYKKPFTFIDTDDGKLVLHKDKNSEKVEDDHSTNFKYAIGTLSSTSKANISTYFPKTFAMQYDFKEEWINNVINKNLNGYDYEGLNAYINKYFDYIFPLPADIEVDKVQEYYDELLADILVKNDETGLYAVIVDDGNGQNRLINIMQNIFVYAEQDIVVYDIEVGKIEVSENISYTLFSDASYDNNTVGEGTGAEYLGVTLIAKDSNDINNSLLKGDIEKLIIAPYSKVQELSAWEINSTIEVPEETVKYDWETVVVDHSTDIVIESGPKVEGTEYLKYVRIDGEWYKYDNSKLEITTTTDDGKIWNFNVLNPTASTSDLVVVYSIESINANGESNWVYAKSNVNINYSTPSIFGFTNNDTKMIYDYTPNVIEPSLKNTTGYLLNSLTLRVSDVIDENALENLQYKNVRFFMVKATNTFKYNGVDYNVFDVDPSWKTCTLSTIDGSSIAVGNYSEFYDLGSNPTLNIHNITSLNDEDPASKVKIFACIMQSDKSGNLVVDITYDSDQNETSREYRVAYYNAIDGDPITNDITIDHFASKLFAYVKVGDKWVSGSQNRVVETESDNDTIKTGFDSTTDSLIVYISAYELTENGLVSDEVDNNVDGDGICLTYLNQKALSNYFDLSNGNLKNSVMFATSMPSFSNLQISEIVNPITVSNIDFQDANYIAITLSFNDLSDKIDSLKIGNVTYATENDPLILDFKVYLLPDGELGTSKPYYEVEGFDAYCTTNIRLVCENIEID